MLIPVFKSKSPHFEWVEKALSLETIAEKNSEFLNYGAERFLRCNNLCRKRV